MPNFSTGFAQLPDVGILSYNGVTFSSLFSSSANVNPVRDEANRTVKWEELTIRARGYVTLQVGFPTTDVPMSTMLVLLQQDGGTLSYAGKGLGQIVVNAVGGQPRGPGAGILVDCNWGPKTKVLSFQPLGASRSALVEWEVTTWVPSGSVTFGVKGVGPVLQFNEEITISYDEDAYSTYSVKGTLEIPLTRLTVNSRTLNRTVDDYRQAFLDIQVDLTRYRVPKRDFNFSRDRRTCTWEFRAEELPPMALPEGITTARGNFSVRPAKQGLAILKWNCSLRCSYTVRADGQRRWAYDAFMSLLSFRMAQSSLGDEPAATDPSAAAQQPKPSPGATVLKTVAPFAINPVVGTAFLISDLWKARMQSAQLENKKAKSIGPRRAYLFHFGFDEGLYLDSKTVSFEATWYIICSFQRLLDATGIWRQLQSSAIDNRNKWAISMKDIAGWRGNLINALDPTQDVIVDLGGP